VPADRSGVADSIEQHMMNWDKPGGQTLLGVELNHIEYADPTLAGRRQRKAGQGWRSE
jgi:hypothetical protein